MASYTTAEDWKRIKKDYVVAVAIRRTDDGKYPSGWDYSLNLGEVGGRTLLRYDNAHERSKGHERHSVDGVTEIEFPGMLELYERFKREVEAETGLSWFGHL